jgi:hypothetical protein
MWEGARPNRKGDPESDLCGTDTQSQFGRAGRDEQSAERPVLR